MKNLTNESARIPSTICNAIIDEICADTAPKDGLLKVYKCYCDYDCDHQNKVMLPYLFGALLEGSYIEGLQPEGQYGKAYFKAWEQRLWGILSLFKDRFTEHGLRRLIGGISICKAKT